MSDDDQILSKTQLDKMIAESTRNITTFFFRSEINPRIKKAIENRLLTGMQLQIIAGEVIENIEKSFNKILKENAAAMVSEAIDKKLNKIIDEMVDKRIEELEGTLQDALESSVYDTISKIKESL